MGPRVLIASRTARCMVAATGLVGMLVSSGRLAQAASATWTGATDANWNVVTNWSTTSGSSPGIVYTANATNTTDVATFNSNPANGNGTTNPIAIETNRMIGRIVFDTANAGSFTIGPVSGTTVFTFGNNLTILSVTGSVTNPQTINYPVALHLPSSTNGSGTITNDAASPNATLILAGGIVNSPNSTRGTAWTLGGSNTGENTISGRITGTNTGGISSSITKTGVGTWVLSGSNTVTAAGGFTINGGVLAAANDYALGDSATANNTNTTINNGGTLEIRNGINLNNGDKFNLNNGGTIRVTGTATTNGRINVSGSAAATATLATVGAGDLFTVGNEANDLSGGAVSSVVRVAGPGTVLLPYDSNYVGGWSVDAGTLKLGSATSLGAANSTFLSFGASSTGKVQLNGYSATVVGLTSNAPVGSPVVENGVGGAVTLTVNNASSGTFAGTLQDGSAGTLALTKGGAGTLTLAGVNTYTGATLVSGGVLAVTGTTNASGGVSVANGAALGGSGLVAGAVTIASGGTVAPGPGIATLTLGSLTLDAGSKLAFEFNSTPANDKIIVSSPDGLTINGGDCSFFLAGTPTAWGTNGTYNLVSFAGSIGGSGIGSLSAANAAPGKQYAFATSGSWVTLTVSDAGVVSTWNVNSNGLWGTPSNWTAGEPNAATDAAIFGSAITAPRTVQLNADKTIGGVTFDNAVASYTIAPSSTQTLTIGDGSGTKVVQVLSGTHSITAGIVMASTMQADVAAGQKLTLAGVLSGGGSLTKTQDGTLVLSTSNGYTGSTSLNAGITEFVAGALGNGSSLALGGGATLKYAAGNTEDISTKTVTIGSGGATLDIGGNDVSLANSIGNYGAGGLTKTGSGTLTLDGYNTYTGQTTISSGWVSVAADASLGDPTTAAGVVFNGGSLRARAGFTTARPLAVNAAATLDVPGEADSLVLGGTATGAGLVTKTGSGTLHLDGPNTALTGGITLAGGTVTLGGGQANGFQGIGTGTITFQNGSVLNLNGFNGAFNGTSWGTLANTLVVPAGQSGTMNLPGRCAIASTLIGSGTMGVNVQYVRGDLSGNWSGFTGQINVGTVTGTAGGDLRLNSTSGFGTASVNLAAGVNMYPIINYTSSPTTFTIGALSGDAGSTISGQGSANSGRIALYSVGGRNTDAVFAGSIRDGSVSSVVQPTAITKVGTGVWTLTGTNTYTGATTVSGGTLYVNSPNGDTGGIAQTSSITINAGGTLRSSANALFGWINNQGKDITVNAGGTLTADNGADVHVGRVTLNGGVLASSGSSVDWGSWVFDGPNTILAVTDTSTASAVNVRIQNGGSIDVAAGKTLSFAGTITDSGAAGASSLIKTGSGVLALIGASSYTGTTAVNAGTLFVDTAITSSTISVASAATLGGSGTVGEITMSAGALLAPGDGVGRLTVAQSLTLTGSSGYLWQLTNATGTAGSTTGWDLLSVTGTLAIAATSADPFQIDLWTLTTGSPVTSGSAANFDRQHSYTWKIATATGGISGFAADKFVITTSATNGTGGFANSYTGGTFSLAQSGNDLNLVFTGAAPSVITINVASGTQTQTQAGYPTLSGSVPVLKTGGGTLVLDQANTLTGSTTVQGGVLRLADGAALVASKVVPLAGGTLALSPYLQTTVGGLAPNAGGLTDVGSGMVTVAAGLSAADMVAAIVTGLGDGTWNGTSGITSSVAAASGGDRTVGWLDNGDGTVTFAFAAAGDTNLDWQVDIIDAANFLAGGKFDTGSPASWNEGDFTYDGMVDILDAASFLSNGLFDAGSYNPPPGATAPVAAVPEPSTTLLGLAAIVAGFAVRRRCGAS